MGRANPVSKAREIRRRISIAERARKKYEHSFHDFYNQYVKGDISHEKYHELISRKKEGKDIQEWIDYLDEYISDLKRRLKERKYSYSNKEGAFENGTSPSRKGFLLEENSSRENFTLEREIRFAREKRDRVSRYIKGFWESYTKGEISYREYREKFNKKYQGKTVREWISYYDLLALEHKNLRYKKHKKRRVQKKGLLSLFLYLDF